MARTRPPVKAPFGLVEASRLLAGMPDPPGLELITGRNARAVKRAARFVCAMAAGRVGNEMYLGTHALADALGCSQKTAHNYIRRLEALGILKCLWRGGLCRKDRNGNPYKRLTKRASEYQYLGFGRLQLITSQKQEGGNALCPVALCGLATDTRSCAGPSLKNRAGAELRCKSGPAPAQLTTSVFSIGDLLRRPSGTKPAPARS